MKNHSRNRNKKKIQEKTLNYTKVRLHIVVKLITYLVFEKYTYFRFSALSIFTGKNQKITSQSYYLVKFHTILNNIQVNTSFIPIEQ